MFRKCGDTPGESNDRWDACVAAHWAALDLVSSDLMRPEVHVADVEGADRLADAPVTVAGVV